MPHPGPMGMFDSGMVGLSVMREVRLLLPREDILHFADSAQVLEERDLATPNPAPGEETFYTSADPAALTPVWGRLWGRPAIIRHHDWAPVRRHGTGLHPSWRIRTSVL